MKNIIVGLLALPIVALVIGLGYFLVCAVLSGVAVAIGLVATFGPLILGGVAAIAVVLGVIYVIGSIVRGLLTKNSDKQGNE